MGPGLYRNLEEYLSRNKKNTVSLSMRRRSVIANGRANQIRLGIRPPLQHLRNLSFVLKLVVSGKSRPGPIHTRT